MRSTRTKRRTIDFPSLSRRRLEVIRATKDGLHEGSARDPLCAPRSFLRPFFWQAPSLQATTSPFTLSFAFYFGLRVCIPHALTVIVLMHLYVVRVNFTTKSRLQIISQGSTDEKNTHAQRVQMRRILLTNEDWWWDLLVWRNHA